MERLPVEVAAGDGVRVAIDLAGVFRVRGAGDAGLLVVIVAAPRGQRKGDAESAEERLEPHLYPLGSQPSRYRVGSGSGKRAYALSGSLVSSSTPAP